MRAVLLPLTSAPALQQVDTDVFTLRYFGHCLQCTWCHDDCCAHGCDVTVAERDRLLAVAGQLAPFVSAPPERWFHDEVQEDPEYESGRFVRSREDGQGCVLRARSARGCGIHAFALATGRDYHAIKPRVCWLFPVTWDKGVLRPSIDLREDLLCRNTGPVLYDMVRDELAQAFGPALVTELDALRAARSPAAAPAPAR